MYHRRCSWSPLFHENFLSFLFFSSLFCLLHSPFNFVAVCSPHVSFSTYSLSHISTSCTLSSLSNPFTPIPHNFVQKYFPFLPTFTSSFPIPLRYSSHAHTHYTHKYYTQTHTRSHTHTLYTYTHTYTHTYTYTQHIQSTHTRTYTQNASGVEMNPWDVPVIQKRIVETCKILGKPVVIATQMLERWACKNWKSITKNQIYYIERDGQTEWQIINEEQKKTMNTGKSENILIVKRWKKEKNYHFLFLHIMWDPKSAQFSS